MVGSSIRMCVCVFVFLCVRERERGEKSWRKKGGLGRRGREKEGGGYIYLNVFFSSIIVFSFANDLFILWFAYIINATRS